jgi:hypothetical protein
VTAQWVIPSLDPAYQAACLATLTVPRVTVIDNTGFNRGVAASWNLGIDDALAAGVDWLVICSESMRFGPPGGADFEAGLTGAWTPSRCDHTCVYPCGAVGTGGLGWHLIGLSMATVATVGYFDEVFYPAWWEDTDYFRRIDLAGLFDDQAPVVTVDAHLIAVEHSFNAGLVPTANWGVTAPFYEAKWGGMPGDETFTRPYGRADLDLTSVTREVR